MTSAALEAARSSTRGSGGASSGSASPWECRVVGSREARPEESQEPRWGAAKRGTLTVLECCSAKCACEGSGTSKLTWLGLGLGLGLVLGLR